MMKYLQRLGRSLMLPVAVLPVAAILMGIGYWIDPNGWGSGNVLSAFLIKAGSSILDNLGILFAVGIAFGMTKEKDGSAAISGLVAFLVVTIMLAPGSVALLQGVDVADVSDAFTKIDNAFIGILSGLVAAGLFNRFSNIKLPDFLAFFSGKRFVPIITSIVMLAVTGILFYVWPIYLNLEITTYMFLYDCLSLN